MVFGNQRRKNWDGGEAPKKFNYAKFAYVRVNRLQSWDVKS